jgi:amino acid adenylation domain-containing protein
LVAALRLRAARTPGRLAYTFLADGEEEGEQLTYAELDERARAIAAALQEACAPGDRALLLYPPGLDFAAAFFGCLYAGVVAVPAYPPRSARLLPRLLSILEDSAPAVALAPSAAGARVRGWLAKHAEAQAVRWIATDELPPGLAGSWREGEPDGGALAFLQYTSGSTAAPKGVMVSHANLAHNQRVIEGACGHTEESVFVTWLPLYHDLGLIGNLLQAVWVGAPCVLMSPVAFLQQPLRWLKAVSRYGATTSGAPNFAYDLCVRKIPPAERERLDLSSWRVAFNGAEPVRPETLARFAEAFAASGFSPGALYPCYGLAEATLMVSGGRPGELPAVRAFDPAALGKGRAVAPAGTSEGRELVGCGRVLSDLEVAIVDPVTGKPCEPGRIGEIWVAGGSVARGYWNRPEDTAVAFDARLPGGPDGRGPFLRTGDLGFFDPENAEELYVAGRFKDLIILRGRNHYPQDLERTAERAHPSLGGGLGAAFAVDVDGEERLVIVHEAERHADAGDVEEIAEAVRQAVASEHEALVQVVVVVPPGGVPRTSSGKVQRRACRALYLNGELKTVGRSRLEAAESAVPVDESDWLLHAFARAARVDPRRVDRDRPLAALGMDSLAAIEFKNAVEAETGAALPLSALLEGMTLAEAALRIAGGGAAESMEEDGEAVLGREAGDHPLSWGQRSLWFLHRLAPASTAYHIAGAARLLGGVDPERLRRAFQALLDRHPVLRATFHDGPEGPVLRIPESAEVDFRRVDASGWSAGEEAFRPFDLEAGPVLRAALLEGSGDPRIVLSVHHVAADFWSLAVLARELGALYRETPLPPPGALYTDHARGQERMLAGPRGERLWRHWQERLAGAPPLDLPTDRPRPPAQGFRGAARVVHLDPEPLRALAAEHGVTPFAGLLAAWQALLGRASGQTDFLVGSPTAGRPSARLAGVVGYFVNPVALRADLSGDPDVRTWLGRVRAVALDALEHAEYPFALLAERLQPERDPSRPPLVQTMLTLQRAPAPELEALGAFAVGEPGARLDLHGLTLESVALDAPGAQLDLSLMAAMAAEVGGRLAVSLRFDSDLYDAATAERMLGHFGNLLAGLAADPGRRISELPVLSEAERAELAAWNATDTPFPHEAPVHRLFEEWAARAPGRTALAGDDFALSYGELNARANRLARHLLALGAGPETRVGVALERSAEAIVAFLAVAKAGCAYVPLDPAYPAERLALMREEGDVPLLLTRGWLERESGTIAGWSGEDLGLEVDGGWLLYVMFTSGSTGRPKAVGVEHRAVARLVRGADFMEMGPDEVWLQLAPLAFDAATLEVWGALANGGRLVVPPPGVPSAAELGAVLERHGVTALWLTAGLFHQMVESGAEALRPVRQLLAGGDVLSPEAINRALAALPQTTLINGYGPTENTTFTCCHAIREPIPPGASVPIGKPISNTRAHLLDRGLQPVPVGVPGELYAAGEGLARGYLNRPDATAEAFVPSPSGPPGARLYRTGDLARYRTDGAIEFLGRIDGQVKIRGFRVEPGEVEGELARHPALSAAAVVAGADPAGGKRLIAFAVARQPVSSAELRSFLKDRLPEPMVPSALVLLDALPLNANGKVDRRALAQLAPAPEAEGEYEAPRTPIEELLAGLWADLLGASRVGLGDDFFALGGHSLLATRVVARLREPLGVELPLAALFENPTLGDFAAAVERARSGRAVQAPPIVPVEHGDGAPLSFAQERLWFLDRMAPGSAVYNIPAALRLAGRLDVPKLASALTEIARRHEALRSVFADGVQGVRGPEPFPLEVVDAASVSEARRLAQEEAARPFDLERGPLARAVLLRIAPEDHLFVLNLHHIVADGWSLGVLLAELEALYSGGVLPELPVQYADFAVWQRRWLSGEVLRAELDHWRGELAGAPGVLDLPADRPRPPVRSLRGGSRPVAFGDGIVRDLRTLCRERGVTPFMALLAAFGALLHRVTGREDLLIGSPVANRNRVETENLIGLFVNTLVLRAGLAGDPAYGDLLGRLRGVTLTAYDHQDLPFEKLVEELAPERSLSYAPLFQVFFALQNAPLPPLALPGLTMTPEPPDNGTAKFDLALSLHEIDGVLSGALEYASDLFDPATVVRLAGHFEALLAGALAQPDRPLSALPLLAEPERHQIEREWNDSEEAGQDAPFPVLFAAQAARTPDTRAVVFEGESLTYAELDRRANALAQHLREQGVEKGTLVGLRVERSLDLPVGLLGIWKAGGVWLPLDPSYPEERLAFLVEDSGARFVLTPEAFLPLSPRERGPGGVVGPALDLTPGPSPERRGETSRDDPAYVIYTSGSTGRPKGVLVEHGSLSNLLRATRREFGWQAGDVAPVLAPFSFDIFLFELLSPLAVGGTAVLVPLAPVPDLEKLLDLLDRSTRFHAVPALLRQIVDAARGRGRSLKTIWTGGDAVPASLLEDARAAFPDAEVRVLYGPTEGTILASSWRAPREGRISGLPIGRPLENMEMRVCDPAGRPVPVGVPGEIVIGGAGVARGYLNRPEMTAEKFPVIEGRRVYRTGDLARVLPDGTFEFLGRIDGQVKIRGFRIELGEVEAALASHPGVREAVAVAREDVPGDRRLVAYVVGDTSDDLRAHVRERLPEYMVPAAVVALDALPLSPNGKVDRKALPAPEWEQARFAEPRTDVEWRLAALWADLLGVERVGLADGFFALGGHSLLAARLVTRVREAFGVEVPVARLFAEPTLGALAAWIEGATASPLAPIERMPRDGELPLSFAQERLWFLERLEPGGAVYNMPFAVTLRGPVSVSRLEQALTEVVRRHEALRTTFAERGGAPVQIVLPPVPVELPIVSAEMAGQEAGRPFDLEKGPLLRALLVDGDGESTLILNQHHIVSDGGSVAILLRELSAAYNGEPLAELPVQYADYAAWQRREGIGTRHLAAWREALAGAPAALDLPTDRPRPAVQTSRGGAEPFSVPEEVVRDLRAVARREGATLFMTVLAGFAALLHRFSHQEDVVIGSPVANRDRAEIENLIGLFVNTLPLRADLSGNPPFAALLARVRETALAAYAAQDVPFEKLVEELQPRRDLSRSPLFQVMLALEDGPGPQLLIPGVESRIRPLHSGTAKFDLTLALAGLPGDTEGLTGGLEYNADLFDAATVRRMLGALGRLLAGVANPETRVGDLPLLGEDEARQVLFDWNATAAPWPRDLGLHELFEVQAAKTPDAVAVIGGTERWTYRELDARATGLARRLRRAGVGPETLVGVFSERTPLMLAGMLAALKAGGAYLPLDPNYPAERVAFLLEDAEAPVVLAQGRLAPSLPPFDGTVLPLEEAGEEGPRRTPLPRGFVHPEQIAYAVYTSGSTGRPKGVAIRHGSAVNRISWALSAYSPDVLSRVLAATSICFDLSVFELFVPLAAGGAVVLAPDALALPDLPAAGEVTLINTVPSAMSVLARAGAVPASVRVVNLAGEPLRRDLVGRIYEVPGIEAVYDLYGPSEDTTYSTGARIERAGERPPSIGRPLPNTRVYLLDAGQTPVPVGVSGELWIGGAGLARGYLGRPDFTADRFRPDPFSGEPGGRLYRTGDLARYSPGRDGELDFLGRLDHQVKVRGFRIELGEIESALTAHPAVSEAVVEARGEGEERRLVAWAASPTGTEIAILRAHLEERLPAFMVPASWVLLPEMPRTPNGKIDRKALPAPEAVATAEFVAPRNPTEEALAGIWADLLGAERVGVRDDFFSLGGHSLLATRVVSRLRDAFGVELPLRAVFESPTVAALAARLDQAERATAPPIVLVPREGGLPLSFAQERLWFLDRMEPGSPLYNLAAAVRLRGALDVPAFTAALEGVVRRHEALRTTFPGGMQSIADDLPLSLPVLEVDSEAPADIERLAREEARRPFDLADGPLLRASLLRTGPDEHVLLIAMHHIVSDGWSLGVLVRELGTLYGGGSLAPLAVQYADFAAWQRRWMAGGVLASEMAWWRERLAGAPEALDLPTDRPRPAVRGTLGGHVPAVFEKVSVPGATPFMVLLAGFAALLARVTRQDDLLIGSPVANRNRAETEGLIGLFVNTLALRADASGDPTFEALVGRVREASLAAWSHQDLPFEKLVEELRPGRSLARTPLFQVMLALQDPPVAARSLPGLELEPLPIETGTAKFDLTLSLIDEGDRIAGTLEYAADLFDEATAARLITCLRTLLAGAAADPSARLSALPLLGEAERREIVTGWNRTSTLYPAHVPVHRLFERRARTEPWRAAIEDGDSTLTYGELDERAGRLARRLRSLGVGLGTRVGFCLDSLTDIAVAMLGILKTGAAYVPLDPSYPRERLAFMVEDAGLAGVIAPERLREALPDGLGSLDPGAGDAGARFEAPSAGGDALAYVIYTSGSTGRPKGVAVPHRGIVRLVLGSDYVALGTADRVAQASNSSFDAATFEVWGALLNGACLVGVERDVALDPRRFAAFLRERRITTLFLTTALFNQIAREVPDAYAGLTHLLFGGEAVDPARVREVLKAGAPKRLLHVYGPTENTTYTSWHLVKAVPEDAMSAGAVPIGKPIANSRIHVVDAGFEPVPVGVPGELVTGGDGLAWGYLDRPELTAERFVPSPFEAGERLYRTGDLVRRRPDGAIEFLGRIDSQVKIRGFRIEPGEIEAALLRHPAVTEAAVLVREDGPAGRRLAAYVAPSGDPAELRAFLAESLPDSMIPSAWAVLPALPINPNGKVDRRALAALEVQGGDASVAPRTPVEELLAAAWEELLGVRVGVHDDFFALGGHSLLAIRVASRVREVLGVELPLRAVFENPTVAALAAAVEAERGTGPAAPPVLPVPRVPEMPLSFAQERLWFLHQLEPAGVAYNIPAAIRLRGPLDAEAVGRALAGIVARHEALRTTFHEGPVQVVAEHVEIPLTRIDLPEAELPRFAREEAERPFDLQHGPLLRTALVRLGPDEHVLLVTLHHIAADGWSVGVLLREFAALYANEALPPLSVQYADYAVWQREWLRGEALEARLAYWRGRLSPVPPPLELPVDRLHHPRRGQAFQGGREPLVLPDTLVTGLERMGRERGATLFMTLLAAFEALLHRVTGQDGFAVGTPAANRGPKEIEGLIGFFVNTLALRADFVDDLAFGGLLARVREEALGAYAHQDLPFERLVEELAPDRGLGAMGRTPLFQAFLSVQSAPLPLPELPGMEASYLETGTDTAKFELSLNLGREGDSLVGGAGYDAALLDAATVRRLMGHFRTLLEGIVADPGARVSELPLLTAGERAQLLAGWGQEEAAERRPVHEAFEDWAAMTPDAPAVFSEEAALTYRELDEQANRLARRLRRLGVGPDVPVAVCFDRSAGMMVALLGVLKAGGAYVPLDPEFPAGRLAFTLEDSGARALLTDDPGRFPDAPALTLEETAGESAERLPRSAEPGNLAYVIYTSGSTGRPKGVLVEHRHLAAYVAGVLARMEVPEGARFATVSTIAADLGNTVVFAALATGGALEVVSRERLADAEGLAALLERRPVDVLKIVPSHLAALLAGVAGGKPVLPRRLLVLGGEAAPWALVDRVRELGDCRVLNHYGPTETTVGVLTFPTWSEEARRGSIVPLGRPLAGTRVAVVDRSLEILPAGVPGELLIGGPQVARGYLGRPDLTAERFAPDPFGARGERLYRTGDRARVTADGVVEFLGRVDQQVKIRGFRVEPGEVEAALREQPGVREAVVGVRNGRLVAWVVGEAGDLRAALRERLPEAMIPSAFVSVPAIPLTANGKVDRRALPDPGEEVPDAEWIAPRTPVEEVLAGIFAEVLEVERVGAFDGFFDRGGHSLLATRAVSRLREAFGVDLPLRALFEQPTVAGLAERIAEARRSGREASPPIVRRPSSEALPLSFAQERLWFLEQLEPGSAAYHVPRVFRLDGQLDPDALRAALGEIVRRHEALRTVFALDAETGESPVQRVAPFAPPPLPWVDLSGLPEPARRLEAARLAVEKARRPFDLERGPLLRGLLVRLAEREHEVLLTLHHIASDGWSVGVLVREFAALYPAFVSGRPSPLPEPAVQYADYAAWQRAWLDPEMGGALRAGLDWWREQLAGAPDVLELPSDRPRPPVQTYRGRHLPVAFGPETVGPLLALARRRGATPFMALLAGYQALLARLTGQADFLVGSPVANRGRGEIEGLIGFFVNTLVLRARTGDDPAFGALLARVRETTLGAYEHQEIPFEKLVEELRPGRSLAMTPLVQVTLALQNMPVPSLALPELTLTPVDTPGETAKFDLSFVLQEDEGGLSGVVEYATDLFDEATAARFAGYLATLMAGAAADPEARLSDLPLLSAAERRQLLEIGAGAPIQAPDATLAELFERQAERRPNAPAVLDDRQTLTYGELDRRAGALAARLAGAGVGPEVPVGVLLERSAELAVALLAVWKAGGAYLPLDPADPAERLAFLVEDSGARLVVTPGRLADRVPPGPEVLVLEGKEEAPAARPRRAAALPESLAWILYTSGSTGRPKGVGVEHRAAAAHFAAVAAFWDLEESDRVAFFASPSFDVSLEQLVPALLTGASVAVRGADPADLWDPAELPARVRDLGLTILGLTTAYWRQWAGPAEAPAGLRLVTAGGEAMPGEAARRWWRSPLAGIRLLNGYGPTEAVVTATFADVSRAGAEAASGSYPLGRPLPGRSGHVLDAAGHLLPVGVPGELCLGGVLARGYVGRVGRPELTAERFVPDLFGAPGGRLYRTGDRVRRSPDGNLEFLGRLDGQVKVRGFRVEAGEVEAVLARHPGVREAVVAAAGGSNGEDHLVAWYVGAGGAGGAGEPAPGPAELRAFLAARLPEPLIPAEFVVLPALPLTPTGKVDRRALPLLGLPGGARPEQAGDYVAPRTPIEELLAEIWIDLLGIDRVGAHDNFFDLGGHSLQGIRLMARLREDLGVEMKVRALFEAPTLAELGVAVAGEMVRQAGDEMVEEVFAGMEPPRGDHPGRP